tara:strand:- start:2077 stop:2274 length:198 start_codon:yes stop_codon:yes gene_type:complete
MKKNKAEKCLAETKLVLKAKKADYDVAKADYDAAFDASETAREAYHVAYDAFDAAKASRKEGETK